MDMLDDVDLAAAVGARDDVMGIASASDHHVDLLPLSADGGGGVRDAEATPVTTNTAADVHRLPRPPGDGASTPSKRKRRPRVGKRLQLTLIRKYVQYARQFQRLPDRIATEQLLLQGHDEFYLGGGDLGEPRLSYAAFMKLVRNRRCEFSRLQLRCGARSGGSSTTNEGGDALSARATLDEEQQEIRALIEELDRVRQRVAPARVPSAYDPLDGAISESAISEAEQQQRHSVHGHAEDEEHLQMLSVEPDSLSLVGGAETDHSVMDSELSTGESFGSASAAILTGGDVVVSRDKLDLMLRAAQETLRVQRKLLEDVRAIEHRLAGFR